MAAHASDSSRLAPGIRLPPSLNGPFAAVQGAWRFFNNDRIGLPKLARPLIHCARDAADDVCRDRLLVALDWCNLHFGGHGSKRDRVELAHSKDLGYDMLTALAIGDRDGSPIAPLVVELRAKDGVHTTRADKVLHPKSQLDNLQPVMDHVAGLEIDKPPVFIIDREGDSVGHYRAWDDAGHSFLARANDAPRVLHRQVKRSLGNVADLLKPELRFSRDVEYKGKRARQYLGETVVTLTRPARLHRMEAGTGRKKHKNVAGRPISLRLVVCEVRDGNKVLARWLLLTNLPSSLDASTVALWYYWRWRIESYHKLLKSAGLQMQEWQQETAAALTRRLLVAAMSAALVWRLADTEGREATELRDLLVRLSGRQMKRGRGRRAFTEPALLAGLGVLISMLELLRERPLAEIESLIAAALPWANQLPRPAPRAMDKAKKQQ